MRLRRLGKIARLPKSVRDDVSRMMQDNVLYRQILERLDEHGRGLGIGHLNSWKRGGYQDWLAEQQRLADMQAKREFALATVKASPIENLHETAMQLAAAQLYEVISGFDLAKLKNLLADKPAEYNSIVTSLTRVAKANLDLEKYREQLQEQKRKIEAELGAGRKDGGLSDEAIAKIEEALNLM